MTAITVETPTTALALAGTATATVWTPQLMIVWGKFAKNLSERRIIHRSVQLQSDYRKSDVASTFVEVR
jgi:hypothetical protein